MSYTCPNAYCLARRNTWQTQEALDHHLAQSRDCSNFVQSTQSDRFTSTSTMVASNPFVNPRLQRNVLNPYDPLNPYMKKRSADLMNEEDSTDGCTSWEGGSIAIGSTSEGDFLLRNAGFCYTQEQRSIVNLIKLLSDIDAPDAAFGRVMQWANDCHGRGIRFNPRQGYDMNNHYKWMRKLVANSTRRLPSVIPVTFENQEIVEVVGYEFAPAILSILQDPHKMTKENLAIDIDNPLAKYVSPRNVLSEALSGSVYQDNFDRYIKDVTKDLCAPLICWFDKSHVTANGKFTLQPFMFTIAIFTEKFRRTIDAWGVMGYLPAFQHSSAFRSKMKPGEFLRGYHLQLDAILASYCTSEIYLRDVDLPIGPGPNRSMIVNLRCPILFVIQDMEEGDRLSGRMSCRQPGVVRQCRACNIHFADLNATDRNSECEFVTKEQMTQIALSDDPDLRKSWSMHYLNNAFSKIDFMDNEHGIFGSTPTEPLHCLRKGAIEICCKIILRKDLSQSAKSELDNLCVVFHRNNRQTYRKHYPRTHFSRGITHLTQITAAEYVGVIFLFVIICQYDEGWRLISRCLGTKKGGKKKIEEVVQAFEALLCFDQWLRKPEHWNLDRGEEAFQSGLKSILGLMRMLKRAIPRVAGNEWNLAKFHELLHLIYCMLRYGSAFNFTAESTENFLKTTVKKMGKKCQKRKEGTIFEQQSARRLSNHYLIEALHKEMNPWSVLTAKEKETEKNLQKERNKEQAAEEGVDDGYDSADSIIKESVIRGTKCTLKYCAEWESLGQKSPFEVKWKTVSDVSKLSLDVKLLEFLVSKYGKNGIHLSTEYQRDNHIFRCHPNYQDYGGINDWMRIVFRAGLYPCRLAAVVIHEELVDGRKFDLIVQSCTRKTGVKSVLLTEWEWDAQFHVVEPDNIHSPCFVVSIKPDSSKVLEVLPLEDWADQFTSSMD